jgi:hypothetical protein
MGTENYPSSSTLGHARVTHGRRAWEERLNTDAGDVTTGACLLRAYTSALPRVGISSDDGAVVDGLLFLPVPGHMGTQAQGGGRSAL